MGKSSCSVSLAAFGGVGFQALAIVTGVVFRLLVLASIFPQTHSVEAYIHGLVYHLRVFQWNACKELRLLLKQGCFHVV